MRNPITGAIVALTAAVTLAACQQSAVETQQEPAAQAATEQARIAGQPNLNGIWQAAGSAHWNLEAHAAEALTDFWQLGAIGAIPAGQSVIEGGDIPYLPEALQQREQNRAGWPAADPETNCFLPGIPRATYLPYPFHIIQGGGDILFVYEFHSTNRLVNMGEWIDPPIDTWMGQSNGHWEGDTLVVETVGSNGKPWLDRAGNHHSNALRVTERFTLMGQDHIEYEATLEDPNTYSAPWTMSMPLYRRIEPNAQLLEYKCVPFVEELRYKDLELE